MEGEWKVSWLGEWRMENSCCITTELHMCVQAMGMALATEFKEQVFLVGEGHHKTKPRILTTQDWMKKLSSFFRSTLCAHCSLLFALCL